MIRLKHSCPTSMHIAAYTPGIHKILSITCYALLLQVLEKNVLQQWPILNTRGHLLTWKQYTQTKLTCTQHPLGREHLPSWMRTYPAKSAGVPALLEKGFLHPQVIVESDLDKGYESMRPKDASWMFTTCSRYCCCSREAVDRRSCECSCNIVL